RRDPVARRDDGREARLLAAEDREAGTAEPEQPARVPRGGVRDALGEAERARLRRALARALVVLEAVAGGPERRADEDADGVAHRLAHARVVESASRRDNAELRELREPRELAERRRVDVLLDGEGLVPGRLDEPEAGDDDALARAHAS